MLHGLNEAGRFEDVVTQSAKFIKARPKDYALRLQVGKALLSLGRLKDASAQLNEAVKHSKGLAAWPWFYVAAVHARAGEKAAMFDALERALLIDRKLASAARETPWFAAFWKTPRFQSLAPGEGLVDVEVRPSPGASRRPLPALAGRGEIKKERRGSTRPPDRAPSSPRAKPKRKVPVARGRTRGGASSRRRGGA